MIEPLLSSKDHEWRTPQGFFDALHEKYRFTLDAAASADNAKCPRFFDRKIDGLAQSWAGERIFVNPPYGRELPRWVKKAHDEAYRAEIIVMLIPARTDTNYFHDYILGKAEIQFLRGRLSFPDKNGLLQGRAPFPSMVVVYA